jgi:hypothetical protein
MRGFSVTGAAAVLFVLAAVMGTTNRVTAAEPDQRIHIVVTTGGHDFDRKGFVAMWDSFKGIAWREGKMEKSAEAYTVENLKDCDVLVTYDMAQKITDEQKAALLDFLKRGGGWVVLHHSIISQPDWPDYERIVGAKYFLKPATRDGKEYPKSGYQHDVDMRIHVADSKHPITEGMSDYDVHDEAYSGYLVRPNVHVLLTTDHPKSNKEIAWTREEGKARVAVIALGHDNKAYGDPNFQKIVERAIRWAGRK